MQDTMLDSVVSSNSQELFSDLYHGSGIDDLQPNVVLTKKKPTDVSSIGFKWQSVEWFPGAKKNLHNIKEVLYAG